jgi:outer membrane protein assembly factor BamB
VPNDVWPRFRGADAGAAADDPSLPDTWSATENVVWSAQVPGKGWSSPVVWGDQIFVTAAVSSGKTSEPMRGIVGGGPDNAYESGAPHRWMVYSFDFATGKLLWERELRNRAPSGRKHNKNSFASATPVTDGERLFVFFADVGLFALSLDGHMLWAKETPAFESRTGWGTGASPAFHDNRIFVTHGGQTSSFLGAFDSRTGNELWRREVPVSTPYASPFVWTHPGRTEVVLTGADKIRSFGLNGELLWELKGMTWIAIPTPLARHGLLYVTSGFPGDSVRPAYAIRPGASGDISLKDGETSNEWIAWFHPLLGPYNPSALVYGDYYYTLLDRGFVLCHDAKTGKQVYARQRISADAGGFTSSPWAYNGKIFALSEDGDTYVIQAGPEFKLLGKNRLIDETTLATPAIARGSVFIRTATRLFRIAKSRSA